MRAPIAALITTVLFLSTFSCVESVDPYFDEVSDLQTDLVEDSDRILIEATNELEECESALFSMSACDRAIDLFGDWGDLISEARGAARTLDPPRGAMAWHEDYLTYLSNAVEFVNTVVDAYNSGDYERFDREFARIDDLIEREDELAEEFEAIQRRMGAQ